MARRRRRVKLHCFVTVVYDVEVMVPADPDPRRLVGWLDHLNDHHTGRGWYPLPDGEYEVVVNRPVAHLNEWFPGSYDEVNREHDLDSEP